MEQTMKGKGQRQPPTQHPLPSNMQLRAPPLCLQFTKLDKQTQMSP